MCEFERGSSYLVDTHYVCIDSNYLGADQVRVTMVISGRVQLSDQDHNPLFRHHSL
jgi:hypothetical protein